EDEVIGLDDLIRFVRHPVKAFLRRRLNVSLGPSSDEPEDGWPLELDGLAAWGVGDRILSARLSGVAAEAAAVELARGVLPPGVLAAPHLATIQEAVDALVARVEAEVGALDDAETADVAVRLADGRRVVGTVPGITGDLLWSARYSKLQPKYRLEAWVHWLALSAALPGRDWWAVSIGRAQSSSRTVSCATLRAPEGTRDAQAFAAAQLETLVALYDRGMREPLPLHCRASAAYAEAARDRRRDRTYRARKVWEDGRFAEGLDAEHQLVLSGIRTFDGMAAVEATEAECGSGWDEGEPSRFARYALRLWSGLLACETVEDH
ncbi:MAG: exodeoxyribonuclease V subunit gamma, partial [Actinomycetota bacterium]